MSGDAIIAHDPIPVYPFLVFLSTDVHRVSRVTNTQIEQRVRRISSADSISPFSISSNFSLGGKEIDNFGGLAVNLILGLIGLGFKPGILREMERAPKEPDLVGDVELR